MTSTGNAPLVLFYVQSLLGIGHLRRAAAIARACAAAGMRVCILSGSAPSARGAAGPFAGLATIHLPPLQSADTAFSGLVTPSGDPPDEAYWASRQAVLVQAVAETQPAAIVIELFPFGRRMLRRELVQWLGTIRAQMPETTLISSVRDVLIAPSAPAKAVQANDWLRRYFDAVLIHSDPSLFRLEETFPIAADQVGKLIYTGYVVSNAAGPNSTEAGAAVRDPKQNDRPETGSVLISAGGGAAGESLFRLALKAKRWLAGTFPEHPSNQAPWTLIAGPNLPDQAGAALLEDANTLSVRFLHAVVDLMPYLEVCRVSICQGGYNTVMEHLKAGRHPIIVPFDDAGETEQTMRALRFDEKGWLTMLRSEDRSPAALARRVIARWETGNDAQAPARPDLSGAANSAAHIAALAGHRSSSLHRRVQGATV